MSGLGREPVRYVFPNGYYMQREQGTFVNGTPITANHWVLRDQLGDYVADNHLRSHLAGAMGWDHTSSEVQQIWADEDGKLVNRYGAYWADEYAAALERFLAGA